MGNPEADRRIPDTPQEQRHWCTPLTASYCQNVQSIRRTWIPITNVDGTVVRSIESPMSSLDMALLVFKLTVAHVGVGASTMAPSGPPKIEEPVRRKNIILSGHSTVWDPKGKCWRPVASSIARRDSRGAVGFRKLRSTARPPEPRHLRAGRTLLYQLSLSLVSLSGPVNWVNPYSIWSYWGLGQDPRQD